MSSNDKQATQPMEQQHQGLNDNEQCPAQMRALEEQPWKRELVQSTTNENVLNHQHLQPDIYAIGQQMVVDQGVSQSSHLHDQIQAE